MQEPKEQPLSEYEKAKKDAELKLADFRKQIEEKNKTENKREPKLIITVGAKGCGKYTSKENQIIIDDVDSKIKEEPVIKIVREFELYRHDLDYIHDGIIDLLDGVVEHVTDEQIGKLLTLCPEWDGIVDTLGKGEILDAISQHFVGMDVPTGIKGDDYFNKFYKAIQDKKEEILKFIE